MELYKLTVCIYFVYFLRDFDCSRISRALGSDSNLLVEQNQQFCPLWKPRQICISRHKRNESPPPPLPQHTNFVNQVDRCGEGRYLAGANRRQVGRWKWQNPQLVRVFLKFFIYFVETFVDYLVTPSRIMTTIIIIECERNGCAACSAILFFVFFSCRPLFVGYSLTRRERNWFFHRKILSLMFGRVPLLLVHQPPPPLLPVPCCPLWHFDSHPTREEIREKQKQKFYLIQCPRLELYTINKQPAILPAKNREIEQRKTSRKAVDKMMADAPFSFDLFPLAAAHWRYLDLITYSGRSTSNISAAAPPPPCCPINTKVSLGKVAALASPDVPSKQVVGHPFQSESPTWWDSMFVLTHNLP